MKTILLIDDCDDFREMTRCVLLDAGFDVLDAPTPSDAFPILKKEKCDLIICDLHMPFCSGKEKEDYVVSFEVGLRTIKELRTAIPNTPIIALSSIGEGDIMRLGKFLDPTPAFSKPRTPGELLDLIAEQIVEPTPHIYH